MKRIQIRFISLISEKFFKRYGLTLVPIRCRYPNPKLCKVKKCCSDKKSHLLQNPPSCSLSPRCLSPADCPPIACTPVARLLTACLSVRLPSDCLWPACPPSYCLLLWCLSSSSSFCFSLVGDILLLNLKLRHDLQEAKEDMSNFIVDTSLEISKGELASTISWGWMAAISGVILTFLVLFLIKIIRNCKDSRETSWITPPSLTLAWNSALSILIQKKSLLCYFCAIRRFR